MRKILIIDDDPDIVESMKIILEDKKYNVVAASNGKEGIVKVKQEKPSLIILDIMMETNDEGIGVAREIKKQKESKDIPILMLTSIREKIGFDFSNEAGDEDWLPVDDYCEKPLKSDKLIAKVEALLVKNKK